MTREIVTVAVLASLGGALSTFVGYLGNLINAGLGVPFGAGQFMAGLHVFWITLIRLLVPKKGVGTAGGLLKGFVEFLTGSTHGIVVVLASLIQGMIVDVGATFGGDPSHARSGSKLIWWLFAGISSASNVLVFQAFYFSGAPAIYLFLIAVLAFCSGFIFAGYFAWETMQFLHDTGVITATSQAAVPALPPKPSRGIRNLPAAALLLFLAVGSTFYVAFVMKFFSDPYSCDVAGLVSNPYTFTYSAFAGQQVTIVAELNGAYTHLPPANYTGVLLSTILGKASPQSVASMLGVIARDGYIVDFVLDAALNDTHLVLTKADDGLWLIAGNYAGSMWVKQVTTLRVY
jgi:energy-coupling factor transport system substrate-specific component